MSLGTPRRSVALEKAVLGAQEKGILLVAAAGNGGVVEYPAAYDAVVSVGAVNHEGELATVSSGREETNLLAPGEDVAAASTFFGADYKSGTSMAAPHVAGLASLLWKRGRNMSAGFIRELLETVTYFWHDRSTSYGGLKEIIVKEGNAVYRSVDGVVYDKQMKTLLWCPSYRQGVLSVPAGVEVIGEYACESCGLSGICLPDSLQEIGKYAFTHSRLTDIVIPDHVGKIGEGAFERCGRLKCIRIPDHVKKIEKWVFDGSDKVTIECSDKSYAKSCAIKRGIPYRIVKKVSAGKLGLTVNGQSVKDNQALKVKVKKSYTVQALRGGIREEVKWKTSNAKVAAAKNGKITVKKAGRATITATASNGKKTRIKLSASKAEVRLSRVQVSGSKTMEKGSKQVLGLTVTPATANSTKVSWKSSDKKTATVDKTGKVTAKKKGTVVITATARDKSRKKGSIKIKVK